MAKERGTWLFMYPSYGAGSVLEVADNWCCCPASATTQCESSSAQIGRIESADFTNCWIHWNKSFHSRSLVKLFTQLPRPLEQVFYDKVWMRNYNLQQFPGRILPIEWEMRWNNGCCFRLKYGEIVTVPSSSAIAPHCSWQISIDSVEYKLLKICKPFNQSPESLKTYFLIFN